MRVHPEILRGENLPEEGGKNIWDHRFRSIRDIERHLHANGTRVVKFFLHLSKEEQRKRFLARIDQPDKNWKFDESDMAERGFWKDYMHAYQACLQATSTQDAPWYVVPADDKQNARLIVSQIILQTRWRGSKCAIPRSAVKKSGSWRRYGGGFPKRHVERGRKSP